MSGRNAQVSRIYSILTLLEGAPQGLTVKEIADRIEDRGHKASKRTVYRDLEALAAAGFPLFPKEEAEDSSAVRWILERTAKIGQYLVLSPRELVALYLARESLRPLEKTPFYTDLQSVFTRIEEKLGSKAQEHLQELTSEIRFEPGPKWGLGVDPDVVETVRAACSEGQQLSYVYSSVNSGDQRKRIVGPHYIYFARGSLYLLGEDLQDKKVKVFAVPRMTDVKMLDVEYKGLPIDPEEYFKDSFGIFKTEKSEEVVIRFSATVSPYVRERSWHHSQKVVRLENGEIEVRLFVGISPELVQWVLGFGAEALVQSPLNLREKVMEQAKTVCEKYLKQNERKTA